MTNSWDGTGRQIPTGAFTLSTHRQTHRQTHIMHTLVSSPAHFRPSFLMQGRKGRKGRKEVLESFVAVAQSCSVRLRQACSMASFTKSKATPFTVSLGIAMTRQQDKETSTKVLNFEHQTTSRPIKNGSLKCTHRPRSQAVQLIIN